MLQTGTPQWIQELAGIINDSSKAKLAGVQGRVFPSLCASDAGMQPHCPPTGMIEPGANTIGCMFCADLHMTAHLELGKALLHLLLLLSTIHNLTNLILKLVQLKPEEVIQLEVGINGELHLQDSAGRRER